MLELIQNVAGITGVFLTLALILMVSSSTEVIRYSVTVRQCCGHLRVQQEMINSIQIST